MVNNFPGDKAVISILILPLKDRDFILALYDLTTVRSTGNSEVENDLRQIGKSKEAGGFAVNF